MVEATVDARLFMRAQKMLADLYVEVPEDEMLRRLRLLLHRKGKLSGYIINEAPGVPCVSTLAMHFGSLRKAYARIGYVPKYRGDWFDERKHWDAIRSKHAASIVAALQRKAAGHVKVHQAGAVVTLDKTTAVTVLVARHQPKSATRLAPEWRAYYKRRTTGVFVVLRLNEANRDVEDFVVAPASAMTAAYLFLGVSLRPNAARFKKWPDVVGEIAVRLKRTKLIPGRSINNQDNRPAR